MQFIALAASLWQTPGELSTVIVQKRNKQTSAC